MQWFRFYHEALDDPKVQMLPAHLFKHWVNLLCVASRETFRGTLPDATALAFQLRIDIDTCNDILHHFVEAGLLDRRRDGKLEPHNWNKRQPKSDDITARVHKHRDAQPKRNVTRNVPGNKVVTPSETAPDTEKEADTETEERQTQKSIATAAPRKPKPERVYERNPTWDALSQLCGEPATGSEKSDFALTVKELTAAEATPDEIAGFGPWWWQAYPDIELTHRCLRKHFGRYRTQPPRPMQLTDIKNPHIRSALTVDLSDITAELEADPRGRRTHLQGQVHRPRELPAVTRRIDPGD